MKKYFILLFCLCLSMLQATEITGVSIESVSSEIASPYYRPAIATIDGSGLDINGPGTHTVSPEIYMWLSAYGDTAPYITFDLGNNYSLENIRIWNYNEISNWLNRGAKDVDIWGSVDNITFTKIKTVVLSKAPGVENVDFSEYISLDGINNRYIKLDIKSNYGDTGYSGLSEVKFYGSSIPEPSIFTLLFLGIFIGSSFFKKK